jgi:hypothetical protein
VSERNSCEIGAAQDDILSGNLPDRIEPWQARSLRFRGGNALY